LRLFDCVVAVVTETRDATVEVVDETVVLDGGSIMVGMLVAGTDSAGVLPRF
jgi:hypothetical protein